MTPRVGDTIEMRAPYGEWVRACVDAVHAVPTMDGGEVAIVSASGDGPGPYVTSFWPGPYFRAADVALDHALRTARADEPTGKLGPR